MEIWFCNLWLLSISKKNSRNTSDSYTSKKETKNSMNIGDIFWQTKVFCMPTFSLSWSASSSKKFRKLNGFSQNDVELGFSHWSSYWTILFLMLVSMWSRILAIRLFMLNTSSGYRFTGEKIAKFWSLCSVLSAFTKLPITFGVDSQISERSFYIS